MLKYPAIILAGGRATRMGGYDKCLLHLHGKTILAHIVASLKPQTTQIALNTNSPPSKFSEFGLPVIPDTIPGFPGPLAGLLAGMLWAQKHHASATHVLSVAGDTPFLPPDLTERLSERLTEHNADIAIACDSTGDHPVLGLWPTALASQLKHDLLETGPRSIRRWLSGFRVAYAIFPGSTIPNINTQNDLRRLDD